MLIRKGELSSMKMNNLYDMSEEELEKYSEALFVIGMSLIRKKVLEMTKSLIEEGKKEHIETFRAVLVECIQELEQALED